jgi:hypothetical protein
VTLKQDGRCSVRRNGRAKTGAPVGDGVHGVGAHAADEAELLCDEAPVHAKGVAGQRA